MRLGLKILTVLALTAAMLPPLGQINDTVRDRQQYRQQAVETVARSTAGDVLARMALVPRTLEARGLDASPAVRAKLVSVGDTDSARVVDIILRDEIGHVAIGNRWFHHLCGLRGLDPILVHREAAHAHGAPRMRGPLNIPARLSAGFTEAELREIGID
jgi:uncharacterized ferritin-like protein (DUF455 family)